MTVRTPFLNWISTPSANGPIAQVVANFAADNNARIDLRGNYQDLPTVPRVAVIDSTTNANTVTVSLNNFATVVPANVRVVIPIPAGTVFIDATATGGASTFQFYADERDAPPDQPNYAALVAAAIAVAFPPGLIAPYGGSVAPSGGWLLCDGTSYPTATYPALFAVVGYTYGGAGANFNVPDLRGRAPFGLDNMGGVAANRITVAGSGIAGTTLGATGGAESVTLTSATMPTHAHTQQGSFTSGNMSLDHTHFANTGPAGAGVTGSQENTGNCSYSTVPTTGSSVGHTHSTTISGSTANAGSGGAHQNMPNCVITTYIIHT